jgi:hypothetical protein
MGAQVDSPQAKPLRTLYLLKFASGKNYVGQTVQHLSERLRQHRSAARRGSKLAVHSAWRKHGEPVVQVLGQYATDSALHQAEIEAISTMGSLRPGGYNVGLGGETAPGRNPEVARKIALTLTGRQVGAATRARMSASATGKHISAATKARMSAASKARTYGPQSAARRHKAGEAIKAAWADPVKRERLVAARKTAWDTRRKENAMGACS